MQATAKAVLLRILVMSVVMARAPVQSHGWCGLAEGSGGVGLGGLAAAGAMRLA